MTEEGDDREEGGGDRPATAVSTEQAFSLLGDETRLQILLELAIVAREDGYTVGLPFSELRKRVGVTDSGRFNYHLEKLTGVFIEKTDDERYVAAFPGLAVVSAVFAGTYAGDTSQLEESAPWQCRQCEQQMQMAYEHGQFSLTCPEHGINIGFPAPPGAVKDRSLQELADIVFIRALTNMDLARQGICPECWGHTSLTFPADTEEQPLESSQVGAEITCTRCWVRYTTTIRGILTGHPAVRSLYQESGYELADAIIGEQSTSDPDNCTLTVDESVPQATATFSLNGATLTLAMTGDGEVAITREP